MILKTLDARRKRSVRLEFCGDGHADRERGSLAGDSPLTGQYLVLSVFLGVVF